MFNKKVTSLALAYVLSATAISSHAAQLTTIYPAWELRGDTKYEATGTATKTNNNSYTFTSHTQAHTDNACYNNEDAELSYCRKADMNAHTDDFFWTAGRVTQYDFTLKINRWNWQGDPEWVIIFQDHPALNYNCRGADEGKDYCDPNGNHPITTLKLNDQSNYLYLTLNDNSWQWNHDFGSDQWDSNHDNHAGFENEIVRMELDTDLTSEFKITLVIKDGDTLETGSAELWHTNGTRHYLVGKKTYQTRKARPATFDSRMGQETLAHYKSLHQAFGQYWSKGYNTNTDHNEPYNYPSSPYNGWGKNVCANWYPNELDCKSNSIDINNLVVSATH
ncbi:hypothetical protein [Thalassomonas actiniarum]|uniref:Uncharacterized protein n=1 Tax=Thalassomonas actiniarum TaxID=485447 RepID=A0AAE9YVZ4_9GAMM|nr:hypothetical protein [Thalassomonas actiniarum]WDE02196.1 hypothetical protein SG35_031050 [Thalassomonas actiniarum]